VDCGHLLARDRLANMSVANDSREVLPYGRVHTGIPGLPKGKLPEFVQGIPLQCPHVTFKNAFINAGLLIPLGVSTAASNMSRACEGGVSGGRTCSGSHGSTHGMDSSCMNKWRTR
jgi:hypothetical protein